MAPLHLGLLKNPLSHGAFGNTRPLLKTAEMPPKFKKTKLLIVLSVRAEFEIRV